MKPLSQTQLSNFLKRFNDFKNAELRSLEIISATQIKLSLTTQDSARGFDWISLSFLFTDVTDASLVQNSKLPLIDLNDGISIIMTNNEFAFAIGACYNIDSIKNSICYVISKSIKYQESSF